MLWRNFKKAIICLFILSIGRYSKAMDCHKEEIILRGASFITEGALFTSHEQIQKNWDQAYYQLIQSQLPKFIVKLTYHKSGNILFRTKDKQFNSFIEELKIYQGLAHYSSLEISGKLLESSSVILSGLMLIGEDIRDLIERKIHFKELIPESFQKGEVDTVEVIDPEKYSRPQMLRNELIETDFMLVGRIHKFLTQYTPLLNMLLEDQVKHVLLFSKGQEGPVLPMKREYSDAIDQTRKIFSTMRDDIKALLDNYERILKMRRERLALLARQEKAKQEIAEKQHKLEKQRKLNSIPVLKHFTKHKGLPMVSPRNAYQEMLVRNQDQDKIRRNKLSRVRSSPNFDEKKGS